ncbi:MAG: hypothetical protein ACK5HT_19615 [Draconibacterium sp.]
MEKEKLSEIRDILVKLNEQELIFLKSLLNDGELLAREIARILPLSLSYSLSGTDEIQAELVPLI